MLIPARGNSSGLSEDLDPKVAELIRHLCNIAEAAAKGGLSRRGAFCRNGLADLHGTHVICGHGPGPLAGSARGVSMALTAIYLRVTDGNSRGADTRPNWIPCQRALEQFRHQQSHERGAMDTKVICKLDLKDDNRQSDI